MNRSRSDTDRCSEPATACGSEFASACGLELPSACGAELPSPCRPELPSACGPRGARRCDPSRDRSADPTRETPCFAATMPLISHLRDSGILTSVMDECELGEVNAISPNLLTTITWILCSTSQRTTALLR